MSRLFFILFLFLSFPFIRLQSVPLGSLRVYLVNNGLSNSTIWCGMQDRQGFMWFGTGNGLDRFDGYGFQTFKDSVMYGKENMDVRAICEESPTLWWIGHERGVSLFDMSKECFLPFFPDKIKSRIQKISKDRTRGIVWIATRGQGLFRYDCKTGKLLHIKNVSSIMWDLALDEKGNLYAATHQEGLACFDKTGKLFSIYSSTGKGEKYISDNGVKSVLYKDGVLWAGTWKGGLNRIDLRKGAAESFLSDRPISYVPHLRVISLSADGEFLLGTDEGVYVFNPVTRTMHLWDERQIQKLSDRAVHSITVDRSGGVWVGTIIGGLNYQPPLRKKVESYTPFINKIGFSGKIVTAFQEDRTGNLWIATEDGGLNYFDPELKRTKVFLPGMGKNSLSYHNLRSLLLDGDDLWIGTFSKGLDRLNLKSGIFKNYHNVVGDTTSLSDNSVYALFKHSKGDVYIGTVWGLNRYVPSKDCFVRIPEIDPVAQIQAIMEDKKGNIWLATYYRGIYCYLSAQKRWVHYSTKTSGLSFDMTITLCQDREGRIWVGTSGAGLFFYDAKNNAFQPYTKCEELRSTTIYSIVEDGAGNLWMGSDKGIFCLDPQQPQKLQVYTKEDGFQGDQYYFNSVWRTRSGKFYFGGISGFSAFYPSEIRINPHRPKVQITSFQLNNRPVAVSGEDAFSKNITFMDTLELSYQQNVIEIFFSALNYESSEKNRYAYCLEGVDKDWIYTRNHSASYVNLQPGKYRFKVRAANNDGLWGDQEKDLVIIVHPPFWKSLPAYLLYILFFCLAVFFLLRRWYVLIQRKNVRRMRRLHQEKEREMYEQKLTFFTQVAHDIRTPLSLIKGPLEQILQSDRNKEFVDRMLKTMDKNVNHLMSLVDQLLLFRKVETQGVNLEFETYDVKQIVADCENRFRVNADLKEITLHLDMPETPVYGKLDRFAFDKVVSNLLFNAFKFTKDRIDVLLLQKGDFWELQISDNGDGVPPPMRKKIFMPFYTKDGKNGTGIGLSLVKQLVEKHGGTIRVEESAQGGACFIVRLPCSEEHPEEVVNIRKSAVPAGKEVHEPVIADPARSAKYNVLVVEDNADLRGFIVMLLESEYTVFQAEDGEEAVKVLDAEVIHLIVSDVMMPRMDGLELCTYVKQSKTLCYIPFIMLTAKKTEEAYVEGLEQGADAYIPKPFSEKVLLTRIRNLLHSRVMLCQNYWSSPFSKADGLGVNKQDQLFIEELNKRIDANLADGAVDFSIDSLAQELGMSRSVLYRRIKGAFNLAPNEYLKSYKLKYAADLLLQGMRINEVADQLGFSSSSYFAKCFKEQFEMTPKEFLQEQQGNS